MPMEQIKAELTEEKKAVVEGLIKQLSEELDSLVKISAADRIRMVNMGRGHFDLVQTGIKLGGLHPEFFSSNFSIERLESDYETFTWLRKIENEVGKIEGKIKDSATLFESEAYKAVRFYYNAVKYRAASGNKKAGTLAKEMGQHYKRRKTPKEKNKPGKESKT